MAKRGRNRSKRQKQAVVEVVAVEPIITEPVTDVVTERTYITTEPEVEIRRAATLAQALTEPLVAVVKPKKRVRRVVERSTRRAA